MNAYDFPESNANFAAPDGYAESQVLTIASYRGVVKGGSMDGDPVVVTAWKPTPEELAVLNAGGAVYATFVCDGLPPHYLSTDFNSATHPA